MKHAEEGVQHSTRALFRKSRLVATLGKVGRWTLLVVVLGLALIGFLHLTRGAAVRHVRGVAADGAAISVGEPEFPLMATMATGAGLAPGNRIDVMQNGDGTFPRLWGDLRSAQRSITLQLYYGAPGRMADTLAVGPVTEVVVAQLTAEQGDDPVLRGALGLADYAHVSPSPT